jgi:7-carboxy-7-deazaguanine synthase
LQGRNYIVWHNMTKTLSQEQTQLRITEIFYSLQGESTLVGLPTVFIRLTGCPLRCQYCDTAYAFSGGSMMTHAEILAEVSQYQPRYITVTGGEPLAQKGCTALLTQLCDLGYQVSLETSGALPVSDVDTRVIKVLDIKTPASGEVARNHWENLAALNSSDQIKFVICDRNDYEWAKECMLERQLHGRCDILFSPSYQQCSAQALAEWILSDRLPVRFQLQLHKVLWGEVPGH